MPPGVARVILISGFALLTTSFARRAPAQEINCDAGDQEVRRLSFSGNTAFTDAELSKIIVTTASPFARTVLRLPLTARHCTRMMLFWSFQPKSQTVWTGIIGS